MSGAGCQLVVRGAGWVEPARAGGARRGLRASPPPAAGEGAGATRAHGGPFAYPVRNYGRMDGDARRVCAACALALRDAGFDYAEGGTLGIGLLGTGPDGSLRANRAYFEDYVAAGRTLARGNLFVYTLPSSPLAEASIHCGLRGPLLFAGLPAPRPAELLRMAGELIACDAAEALLAVDFDARGALAFLVGPGAGSDGWPLETAIKRIGRSRAPRAAARALGRAAPEGGAACT